MQEECQLQNKCNLRLRYCKIRWYSFWSTQLNKNQYKILLTNINKKCSMKWISNVLNSRKGIEYYSCYDIIIILVLRNVSSIKSTWKRKEKKIQSTELPALHSWLSNSKPVTKLYCLSKHRKYWYEQNIFICHWCMLTKISQLQVHAMLTFNLT